VRRVRKRLPLESKPLNRNPEVTTDSGLRAEPSVKVCPPTLSVGPSIKLIPALANRRSGKCRKAHEDCTKSIAYPLSKLVRESRS